MSKLKRHFLSAHKKGNAESLACVLCEKSFLKKYLLEKHILSAHQKSDKKKIESIKEFHCDICQKKFSLREFLQSHINIVHKNMKLFKCEICEKEFSKKKNMQNHISTWHAQYSAMDKFPKLKDHMTVNDQEREISMQDLWQKV